MSSGWVSWSGCRLVGVLSRCVTRTSFLDCSWFILTFFKVFQGGTYRELELAGCVHIGYTVSTVSSEDLLNILDQVPAQGESVTLKNILGHWLSIKKFDNFSWPWHTQNIHGLNPLWNPCCVRVLWRVCFGGLRAGSGWGWLVLVGVVGVRSPPFMTYWNSSKNRFLNSFNLPPYNVQIQFFPLCYIKIEIQTWVGGLVPGCTCNYPQF